MIYANIWLTVIDPADVATIRNLLVEQRRMSLEEPGCIRFELYHSTTDRTKFLLVERWESQTALDAHRQARAYTTLYQPQVLPRVTREGHVCELIE